MIKVFVANSKGKIELTKEELETLLNEVWQDGYNTKSVGYTWGDPVTTPKTIPPFIPVCSTDDLK